MAKIDDMQVTETLDQGLKREFRVVVPASDLEARVNARLDEIKDRIRLNGFRPGKVPVAHLKKVYGKAAMAEVIEAAVREANAKIVTDRGFKLATNPKVTLPSEEAAVDAMVSGKSDLSYTVEIEIVPPIELADFKTIKLARPVADVTDAEVDDAIGKIVEQNRPFAARGEGEKAASGDRVTIAFKGTIDGNPFEGGTGDDVAVHLGSGTFIPGFEDQVVGMTAGETRTVNVKFPDNYLAEHLQGKDAVFEVTAKTVETPVAVTVDDEFAKSLGMESLAKLKDAIRDRLERDHTARTRQKIKRKLLDELDKAHKFDPPPTLVDEEFANVWDTIDKDLKAQGRSFADEGTTEDAARADYRKIAERRVRLGLVIAEIGDKNGIKVTDEELSAAVVEQARQLPGREQQVWDHYRNNPGALAALRAPIFEDKVVDFLLELAETTEKKVSREELYKDDDE
jgi:trigger factor